MERAVTDPHSSAKIDNVASRIGEPVLNGRYTLLAEIKGSIGGARATLGTKGKCRYCGETNPAQFRQKAHTFPEALGNKWIVSLDECDNCNQIFSKYEDAIVKAIGPFLTLGGVKGKSKRIRQTGRSQGNASLVRRDGTDSPGIFAHANNADPASHVAVTPDGALSLGVSPQPAATRQRNPARFQSPHSRGFVDANFPLG